MLLPDERRLLLVYCSDHAVATCPECSEEVTFDGIGADPLLGRRDFCPMCRADLTTAVRQHLGECTFVRVQADETRERAREIRQEARETAKHSEQLRDRADVLAREAEDVQSSSAAALRESERLRQKAQEAMGENLRIGRDYIPVEDRLSGPTSDGIILADGFGQPPTPGSA